MLGTEAVAIRAWRPSVFEGQDKKGAVMDLHLNGVSQEISYQPNVKERVQ